MNIQVLPHVFKKIGLFLFIAYPVGHFLLGFFDPIQEDGKSGFHPFWSEAIDVGALLGVIIYFISKEKVEDELIKQVRLESMSIAFLLSVGVLLLLSIALGGQSVDASLMFVLQLTLFLILYHYRKKSFSL
ncbi:MAG: hypothetical protein AAF960_11280 [Bacteroidota bacterium]